MQDSKGQTDERRLVVLVDDDENYLRDYTRGVQMFASSYKSGQIEIREFSDPTKALNFVRTTVPRKSLWILDSMMAFSDEFDAVATRTGLLTGVALLRKIREAWPYEDKVSFMIVTNYSRADIENALDGLPTRGIHNKLSCSPRALAALVDQIVC